MTRTGPSETTGAASVVDVGRRNAEAWARLSPVPERSKQQGPEARAWRDETQPCVTMARKGGPGTTRWN
jgi:hypothetical protein